VVPEPGDAPGTDQTGGTCNDDSHLDLFRRGADDPAGSPWATVVDVGVPPCSSHLDRTGPFPVTPGCAPGCRTRPAVARVTDPPDLRSDGWSGLHDRT
jgi:hypothetical protein